jgi:hypothetical protein
MYSLTITQVHILLWWRFRLDTWMDTRKFLVTPWGGGAINSPMWNCKKFKNWPMNYLTLYVRELNLLPLPSPHWLFHSAQMKLLTNKYSTKMKNHKFALKYCFWTLNPYYAFHWYVHSAFFSRFRTAFEVRRRPGYKIWRLFKFSSILLSFKTRHWLFILIYIKFGIFKLEKVPNIVTRPASNVDRRTPFGSEKKMRNAHISEMRSKRFR